MLASEAYDEMSFVLGEVHQFEPARSAVLNAVSSFSSTPAGSLHLRNWLARTMVEPVPEVQASI